MSLAWPGLFALVVFLLAIDLFGHRGDRVDSARRALIWTVAWVVLALAFGAGLWALQGPVAAEEYFAVWLLEKSLSIDNLFVFLVIFDALAIPRAEQRRVLTWGIIGALVTRAIFIAAGAALLQRWHGLAYVFGGLLVLTAVKLMLSRDAEEGEGRIMRMMRRVLPMSRGLHGHHYITRVDGRWLATPLLFALVVVELTDVMFALDSIPAAFAVTENTFVIYSANVFAMFGLRSLYIVLAGALRGLRYLKWGLSTVLLMAGAKLLTAGVFHPPAWLPPLAIAVVMGIAIGASVWANARDRRLQLENAPPRLAR